VHQHKAHQRDRENDRQDQDQPLDDVEEHRSYPVVARVPSPPLAGRG
jgi:hypothetical protein